VKRFAVIFMMIAVVMSLGCYHATIVTGSKAGDTVIDKPWANSFIFGLVPPAVMDVASQCPGGVAKVETEHSFLNWLVGGLTLGIYTPIHIKVTCAATAVSVNGVIEYLLPEADLVISTEATPAEAAEMFQVAAEMAKDTDQPVFVKFAANP
jgi:hypothetical protein